MNDHGYKKHSREQMEDAISNPLGDTLGLSKTLTACNTYTKGKVKTHHPSGVDKYEMCFEGTIKKPGHS